MNKRNFIVFLIAVFSAFIGSSQESEIKHIDLNSEREELQRYFGYEDLLSGYLTLPIDASMNTNEKGYFIDLGFLILILLPILFMCHPKIKNSIYSKILLISLFLIQLIYIATSFILSNDNYKILNGDYSNYTSNNDSFFEDLLAQFYIIGNNIISPIVEMISKVSGSKDYVSYPFLGVMFILSAFMVKNLLTKKSSKAIAFVFLTFSFFWILLSSGILWYGYLGITLAILIIIKLNEASFKILRIFTNAIISLSVFIAIVARISFIQGTPQDNTHTGKYIINNTFIQRSLGLLNTPATIEKVYPGLPVVANEINTGSKDDLIYAIGTSLDYFFDKNQQRIFKDNQLRMFNVIYERFKTKDKINQALKLAGFKYLIIDLNTHTLDKTPERTLSEKYKRLLSFVNLNTGMQLIGTNRIILDSQNNKYKYAVFGEIKSRGTYAVYKIL